MNYSYTENGTRVTKCSNARVPSTVLGTYQELYVHSFAHSRMHSFTEIQAEGETV